MSVSKSAKLTRSKAKEVRISSSRKAEVEEFSELLEDTPSDEVNKPEQLEATVGVNDEVDEDVIPISMPDNPTMTDIMAALVQQSITDRALRREERKAERLALSAQITALTDTLAATLASQKSQSDALQSAVKERESLDRAARRDDKLERIGKALVPMHAGEDVFSLLMRIESVLIAREVDKFNWLNLLERVLAGKYLDIYYKHLDSCAGNWDLMKSHLLNAGGYNIHDCLDMVMSRYRPGGAMSASQWASVAAHRLYVVSKSLLCLDSYSDEVHRDFANAMANAAVLASLPREGRAFVYKSEPKTIPDLLTCCDMYCAKPENSDGYSRSFSNDKPYRKHNYYQYNRKPSDSEHTVHTRVRTHTHTRMSLLLSSG